MMTTVIVLFSEGRESEVVRLSAKAFQSHITLLGHLLGLNSLASPPVLLSNVAPMSRSPSSSSCCPANSPSMPKGRSASYSSFASCPGSSKMSRSSSSSSSSSSCFSPYPSPPVSRSASFSGVRAAGVSAAATGGGSIDGVVARPGSASVVLQRWAFAVSVVLLLVAMIAAVLLVARAAPTKLGLTAISG